MINKIDYFKILDTYDKTVSKRVKNKKSLVKMEMNKISYISNIYNLLVNDKYNFGIAIQTKSALILRDLDILKRINQKSKAVVQQISLDKGI